VSDSFFRRVFRLPTSKRRLDNDVNEELRFHIEERIAVLVAQGMPRDQAEAEARRRFGDYGRYAQETRSIDETTQTQAARMEWVDAIQREVSHAVRVLLRAPAFSFMTFATLALGIAATTAIYTVLEGVLLRPLPYIRPNELVSVMHPTTAPGSGERKWGLSTVGYFHFKEHARTLADIGVYRTGSMTIADPGTDAIEVRSAQATASLFSTLGGHAVLGHMFDPDDYLPTTRWTKVVLSNEFWRSHFGADSGIIGKQIQTASAAYTVIGVLQPGFTLPKPGSFSSTADLSSFGVDVWLTLNLNPATRQNNHAFSGIARLAPGRTADDAQRELASMTAQFSTLWPDVYSERFMQSYNFRVSATPLLDEVLGPTVARALWILFAAVGLVLAIACANVANLFLVRMEARRRESAIRGALGADGRHMAVHYLSESLMLTLSAGVAGVLLARMSIAAILAVAPRNLPRLAGVELHWTSVVFAGVLSIAAGVLFGVLPLVRSRVDVETLREGGRGLTSSPRRKLARDGLVVAQVALALVLLVGAGLMIRSFIHLRTVRSGLDPAGVVAVSISLPYRTYSSMTTANAFHQQFAQRIAALPGVTAVGGSGAIPLRDYGNGCTVVFRENLPYASGEPTPCVSTVPTIPGFFKALGINVRGRAPEWSDVEGKTQAAVVTEALAKRLWPGEDPIGKGIASNGANSKDWYRIVGVVPELRAQGLDQPQSEVLFMAPTPLYPQQETWGTMNQQEFVVKVARGNPMDIVPAIRAILKEMNPSIPFPAPVTMQAIVERSMARTSFIMLLLALSASMALMLSAVGIYGVISYLVAQRRTEIGVRIALGAPVQQVLGLVIGQSVRLALIGVAIGLVGAIIGTRLLQSLLFDVSPTDPLVLTFVPVVLVVLAAAASFAPARRAAAVDPVEALKAS
jgi:putative ABC transport system permease protein